MLHRVRLQTILFAFTCASATLSAATFDVTSDLDAGPGTLRQAILDASAVPLNEAVEINLAPIQEAAGEKGALIDLKSGSLIIQRPMAIAGKPHLPGVTVYNRNRDARLIMIDGTIDGTVSIDGIHFRGGSAIMPPYSGGAIYYEQLELAALNLKTLNLEISNCVFSDNVAGVDSGETYSISGRGGAIFFQGDESAVTPPLIQISDTVFSRNAVYGWSPTASSAATGAAVEIEAAVAQFDNVRFDRHTGNSGSAAGGVIAFASVLPSSYLRHCALETNVIGEGTSGIRVTASSRMWSALTIDRCLIANNGDSGSGSTLVVIGSSTSSPAELDVVNSTIYGNTGSPSSVLFVSNYAHVALRNCTIAGNRHPGPSLSSIRLPFSSGTLQLARTVIAGNGSLTGDQFPVISPDIDPSNGTVISSGYNFIGSGVGLQDVLIETGDVFGPSNAEALDPLLAPLGDYGGKVRTIPPLPDSPLVDAIAPAVSGTNPVDARDISRPQGNFADIGAVELPRTPYNQWHQQLPAEDRAGTADPDGDGLANSLEYFFGTDPAKAEINPVRWVAIGENSFVEFDRWSWIRPAYFSSWRLAFSEDLVNWEPVSANPIVEATAAGSIDYLRYRYPVETEMKTGFFRVEVE